MIRVGLRAGGDSGVAADLMPDNLEWGAASLIDGTMILYCPDRFHSAVLEADCHSRRPLKCSVDSRVGGIDLCGKGYHVFRKDKLIFGAYDSGCIGVYPNIYIVLIFITIAKPVLIFIEDCQPRLSRCISLNNVQAQTDTQHTDYGSAQLHIETSIL